MLRDVNNKLAEELVIQPRLKKVVSSYSCSLYAKEVLYNNDKTAVRKSIMSEKIKHIVSLHIVLCFQVYNYRVKRVKENNPTSRPLPPAPDSPPTNNVSLEPPEDAFYPPPPLPDPVAQRRSRRESELHSNRPRNTYQHHQVSPLPPTMEQDMRSDDPSSNYQRHQPRYISNPRSQTVIMDNGQYSRVQRVPINRSGKPDVLFVRVFRRVKLNTLFVSLDSVLVNYTCHISSG